MSATDTASREASFAPPADLGRLRRGAAILGVVGAIACAIGFSIDSTQFYRSYLVSWLFWTAVTMGCLAILMLQHLSGGRWGFMARRILESAAKTIPFLGLLFIPIAVGLPKIYKWAVPGAAEGDSLLAQKASFLNPSAFLWRSAIYFVLWTLLAWALARWSRRHDASGEAVFVSRMKGLSAFGLVLYVLTTTLAAVDWLMSLDPHWYSSLFGVYFLGGQGVAAFAFIVLIALYLSRREPMADYFQPSHFHDYGKLLLAFVMLWSYFAVSQLLIIWSGHLPEEIGWYIERVHGLWKWIGIALALFHFLLPFLLLLSRDLKRSAGLLAKVAVLLLAMRYLDLFWLAAPSFHHQGSIFHWLDLATLAATGGLWLALFTFFLSRAPLLPLNDPLTQEVLSHE